MGGNETVVIDVAARFDNEITENLDQVIKTLDKFAKSIEKTKKQAESLGKSKNELTIEGKDKTVAMLKKITSAAMNLTKKTWQFTVSVIDKATAPLRKLFDFAFSLKGLLTGIAVGFVGQQLLVKPIGLADQIESSKIFFEKKLGGKEQSDQMLKDIFKFDEKSPFDTMQIIQMVQSMMSTGWNRDNVLDDLGIVGDAMAGMGKGTEEVGSVVRQLGQMKMKGKLSSEEMNSLAEVGSLNVWKYVAEGMGKLKPGASDEAQAAAIAKVRAMSEKGAGINGVQATKWILAGSKRDFEGSAAAMADKTVKGIKDQISSNFTSKIALPWGIGLSEGIKKGLNSIKGYMDKYGDKIKGWGDQLKATGEQFSTYLADKFIQITDKVDKVLNSNNFKNANLQDKFKILWTEVVTIPFNTWWTSPDGNEFRTKAQEMGIEMGKYLAWGVGEGIKAGIGGMGALFTPPNNPAKQWQAAHNPDGSVKDGYSQKTVQSSTGWDVIDKDMNGNPRYVKQWVSDPKPTLSTAPPIFDPLKPLVVPSPTTPFEPWKPHKTGLGYVPFDGYKAELHEGERVLTKSENKSYNTKGKGGGIAISVGGLHFQISGGGDPQSLMALIREQMPTIANEVAEEIAKQLSRTYSNMTLGVEA